MKGYVKTIITEEQKAYIDELISTAQIYIDNFIVKKELKGWWVFKEVHYTYTKEKPPLGVFVMGDGSMFIPYADTTKGMDNLVKIQQLYKISPEVYLGEELSETFNKVCVRMEEGDA